MAVETPTWRYKSEGDKQTASEMNQLAQAVITNATELSNTKDDIANLSDDITNFDNRITSIEDSETVKKEERNQPNGYAGLDSSGKIPIETTYGVTATVTEVETYESLPVTGLSGVIYYVSNTGAQYKWSGSAYIDITGGADNAKKNETSIFDCSNGTSTKYYSILSDALNVVPLVYKTSNRIISYLSVEYPQVELIVNKAATVDGSISIYLDGVLKSTISVTAGMTAIEIADKLSDSTYVDYAPWSWTDSGVANKFTLTYGNNNIAKKVTSYSYTADSAEESGLISFNILKEGFAPTAVNYQYHGIDSTTWTDLTKWERVPNQSDLTEIRSELGLYTDNPEYIRAYTDNEGKFLWGIRHDGSIEWAKGIPAPIKQFVEFLLSAKVSKEEGKSLINEVVASALNSQEIAEFLKVVIDSEEKILMSIGKDGSFDWKKGIPEHLMKYIESKKGETAEQNIAMFNSTYLVGQYLGIRNNIHRNVYNYLEPLNDALAYGLGCIFIIYSSQEYDKKMNCSFIKWANENNIKVYVTLYGVPQWSSSTSGDTTSMQDWNAALDWIASLDGETMHPLEDGSQYACKAYSARFCDELPMNYTSYNLTPLECLEILDYSAEYIRSRNAEIKILSSSLNMYVKEWFDVVLDSTLPNGHRFCNTFDELYIDVYQKPEVMFGEAQKMYQTLVSKQPEIAESKMIYTNGYSSAVYSEEEQAALYARSCLFALAEGASIYIPFCFQKYDAPIKVDPTSYYIQDLDFENAVHLSMLSLSTNEDVTFAGDLCTNIPLRLGYLYGENYIEFQPKNNFFAKIKDGVKIITDKPCTFTSVGLYTQDGTLSKTIWSGTANSDLSLDASTLVDLSDNDNITLRIYFDDSNIPTSKDIVWKKRKALSRLHVLQKYLDKDSTRPQIEQRNGIYIAKWLNTNKRKVFAIWSEVANKVDINIEGAYYIVNSDGVQKTFNGSTLDIERNITYIINAKNIRLL